MAEKDKKKLTKTAEIASDKKTAIQNAMKNIEKMYGKIEIDRSSSLTLDGLSTHTPTDNWGPYQQSECGVHLHRLPVFGPGVGHRRRTKGPDYRDIRSGVLR